jgi:hypothetical protein
MEFIHNRWAGVLADLTERRFSVAFIYDAR